MKFIESLMAMFALIVLLSVLVALPTMYIQKNNYEEKKFSSCSEMQNFLKTTSEFSNYRTFSDKFMITSEVTGAFTASEDSKASDYSTTNIQVGGVDESDIMKNDGEFIYTISGENVSIVKAFPINEMRLLSVITLENQASEMFINDNKLILFGMYYDYLETENTGIGEKIASIYYRPSRQMTFTKIYDITDKENPVLEKEIEIEGYYVTSRMINDYIYLISNKYTYQTPDMPVLKEDNGTEEPVCGCTDVVYFNDMNYYNNAFTTITAIEINSGDYNNEVFLTDPQTVYVSKDNIYLTGTKYQWNFPTLLRTAVTAIEISDDVTNNTNSTENKTEKPEDKQMTVIKKISINKNEIKLTAEGEVAGWVLNQFSMDENDNYFRITTTVDNREWRNGENAGEKYSNVFVLDDELDVVGKIDKIAPGEEIYSARFMGNRAYLVTYRKIDPFFTIDLSNPTEPKILGKLKIPGYSDYLHPYDENHIIGIGKNTIGAKEDDFSWYQGVKISLFDVTNIENPVEISMIEIGDRGTESEALNDHKAFLFNKEKELLVIPITLAEFSSNYTPINDWEYGDYTFQGAYVYKLNLEDGFVYKGRITHIDDDSLLKSGYYYYNSATNIQRTLFMDDILYTISKKTIKANNLDNLEEINSVKLPYSENTYKYY